jgi:hypothetical protein
MEVAVTTSQIAQAADPTGRKIPPGLPMPTDLEMVFDPSRRPRAARETRGRFPFPIPNGWFIVAASADIGPGDVTSLHYFGRDLVLFRGEDGRRICSTPTARTWAPTSASAAGSRRGASGARFTAGSSTVTAAGASTCPTTRTISCRPARSCGPSRPSSATT